MKGTFIVVLLSLICGLAYVNASETNVTITRRDSSNTTVTVSNTVLNETQFANVKKVLQGESSEADNRERWSEIDRRLEERRSKIKVSYHEGLPKSSEHTDPANSKKKRKSDCVAATAPPGKRDITSRGDKFPDSHSHCAIDCGNGINYREVSDFIDDVIHGSHGDLMNDEIGANGGMYTISPTNLNFVLIQLNGGPDPVRLGALSFGGALIPVNGDCTTYQKFGGFQESRDQLNIWLVTTIEVLSDIRGDAMGKFKSCIDHGRSGNMRISNRAIAKKGEATDTLEKPNISSNLSSSNVTPGYIHVYAGCGLNCGNSMDYADCAVLVEDATYNAKRRIEKATGIAPRGSFVGIYGSCGVTVINNDEEREVTVPYNSFAADSLITSNFIGSYSLGGGGEEQAPGLRCTEYLMGEPDRIAPNSAAIEGCIEHANRNVGGCL